MATMITQPPFDKRLTTLAFPLNGGRGGQFLQTGYMIWDKPIPGYSGRAVVRYLYNPSTVSADYSIADASAQASLNFPNPGDTANLAIPLSQTATWSLMFDRTFELWQGYESSGLPIAGNNSQGGGALGVQADVNAFMQFTGMLTNYSAGTQAANISNPSITKDKGIMQLVPAWAFFGNNNVSNGLTFYGYISEWSVQYTHFTQFNVPMRCVVSVTWTMLPNPGTVPPSAGGLQAPGGGVLPVQGGTNGSGLGPGQTFPFVQGNTTIVSNAGIGGR